MHTFIITIIIAMRAFQFLIFISDAMKTCVIQRKDFPHTFFTIKSRGIRRISHIHHIKLFNDYSRYIFSYSATPTNEFSGPILAYSSPYERQYIATFQTFSWIIAKGFLFFFTLLFIMLFKNNGFSVI